MNNLSATQQRDLLNQIENVAKLESVSHVQDIISNYCFPKCVHKIQSRSDELHSGESQCLHRCLWRYLYVHQKVAQFYRKQHPLATQENDRYISDMEADIEKRNAETPQHFKDADREGGMAYWRRLARENAAKEEQEAQQQRLLMQQQQREQQLREQQLREQQQQIQLAESELHQEEENTQNHTSRQQNTQQDSFNSSNASSSSSSAEANTLRNSHFSEKDSMGGQQESSPPSSGEVLDRL